MKTENSHIPTIPAAKAPVKDYVYSSEKRAEWAYSEAVDALKSVFPSFDFDPEHFVTRNGRIVRISTDFPFALNIY